MRRPQTRYFAFLSYSHRDEEIADWLHQELEQFRVPSSLVGRLTSNGVVPKRLTPIFRDERELAAAGDLGGEIESALGSSQFLIVLCSPNAAASEWVNAEIEAFKRSRPDGCVLAAIAAGEPFASDLPARFSEECFPPALRVKFDRRGRPTGKRAEPLAADLRETADGRRMAVLKLIAGMLGVGLDELVQRETTQRHRRLAWLAAASLAGMALTSTLAVAAIQARDEARDQRREAEGLVAFMLGDLKDKLEPIGRLDALDGVGSRVLAYYSKQDAGDLSEAALLQRSRALSLTAQVSYLRGDLDQAARLYREAMDGTGEAIRRNPDDPQRLFDHAQNVVAVGGIAQQRGRKEWVESAAREYKTLAQRMVALQPDNMKWRMEEQYADANLGIALYEQRRFAEAASQFERALRTIEGLATADPGNGDYQRSIAESLAWLADARMSEGRTDEAIARRERQIALLRKLMSLSGQDVGYRQMLVPAHRALGLLYSRRGDLGAGAQQLRLALGEADSLISVERNNSQWLAAAAAARLNLAEFLLAAGQPGDAAAQTAHACAAVNRLVARDSSVQQWRMGLRDCFVMRTRLALSSGSAAGALAAAQQAVQMARTVKSSDPIADRYALARTYRLLGDVHRSRGDAPAAKAAWAGSLAALPRGVAERPSEMSERAVLFERLGRIDEARQLAAKLDSIGYKQLS